MRHSSHAFMQVHATPHCVCINTWCLNHHIVSATTNALRRSCIVLSRTLKRSGTCLQVVVVVQHHGATCDSHRSAWVEGVYVGSERGCEYMVHYKRLAAASWCTCYRNMQLVMLKHTGAPPHMQDGGAQASQISKACFLKG